MITEDSGFSVRAHGDKILISVSGFCFEATPAGARALGERLIETSTGLNVADADPRVASSHGPGDLDDALLDLLVDVALTWHECNFIRQVLNEEIEKGWTVNSLKSNVYGEVIASLYRPARSGDTPRATFRGASVCVNDIKFFPRKD